VHDPDKQAFKDQVQPVYEAFAQGAVGALDVVDGNVVAKDRPGVGVGLLDGRAREPDSATPSGEPASPTFRVMTRVLWQVVGDELVVDQAAYPLKAIAEYLVI
jgi:hypothetical protein